MYAHLCLYVFPCDYKGFIFTSNKIINQKIQKDLYHPIGTHSNIYLNLRLPIDFYKLGMSL